MKRALLPCLLLVVPTLVHPASAACRPLITDVTGDVTNWGANPEPLEDSRALDLTAVDVRSDKKTLVVTVQLDRLDPESQPVMGHQYDVQFASNGQTWFVGGAHGSSGEFWAAGHGVADQSADEGGTVASGSAYEGLGPIEGHLDTRKNRLVLSAPLALFEKKGGLRGSITKVFATTGSGAVAVTPVYGDSFGQRADSASGVVGPRGGPSYRLGSRACL